MSNQEKRPDLAPFETLSDAQLDKAAEILVRALAHQPSAWPNLAAARSEVALFLCKPERLAFSALCGGCLVGWIGALRHSQHAWELHPLVVDPDHHGQGFGRGLVEHLEVAAREDGICTIWLGTDDDFGGTNLFGIDLYPDVLDHLQNLAPTLGHPFTFYRHMGYRVVGVIPDANGPGMPDLLMAKRVSASPE